MFDQTHNQLLELALLDCESEEMLDSLSVAPSFSSPPTAEGATAAAGGSAVDEDAVELWSVGAFGTAFDATPFAPALAFVLAFGLAAGRVAGSTGPGAKVLSSKMPGVGALHPAR